MHHCAPSCVLMAAFLALVAVGVVADCGGDSCHSLASCVNASCVCRSGYVGNGLTNCTDIDECTAATPQPCSVLCVNTHGSFTCPLDGLGAGDNAQDCSKLSGRKRTKCEAAAREPVSLVAVFVLVMYAAAVATVHAPLKLPVGEWLNWIRAGPQQPEAVGNEAHDKANDTTTTNATPPPPPASPTSATTPQPTPYVLVIDFAIGPLLAVVVLVVTTLLPPRALVDALFKRISVEGASGVSAGISPWEVLVIFFGLAYVTVSWDATGVFEWAARGVLARAGSSGRSILAALVAFASVLTVATSNDIVILTATPLVAAMARGSAAGTAFVRATILAVFYAANTFSLALLIGNPTNIILGQAAGITFIDYVSYMILPTLAAGAASCLCSYVLFVHFLAAVPDSLVDGPTTDNNTALKDAVAEAAAAGAAAHSDHPDTGELKPSGIESVTAAAVTLLLPTDTATTVAPSEALRDPVGAAVVGLWFAICVALIAAASWTGWPMWAVVAGGAVGSLVWDTVRDLITMWSVVRESDPVDAAAAAVSSGLVGGDVGGVVEEGSVGGGAGGEVCATVNGSQIAPIGPLLAVSPLPGNSTAAAGTAAEEPSVNGVSGGSEAYNGATVVTSVIEIPHTDLRADAAAAHVAAAVDAELLSDGGGCRHRVSVSGDEESGVRGTSANSNNSNHNHNHNNDNNNGVSNADDTDDNPLDGAELGSSTAVASVTAAVLLAAASNEIENGDSAANGNGSGSGTGGGGGDGTTVTLAVAQSVAVATGQPADGGGRSGLSCTKGVALYIPTVVAVMSRLPWKVLPFVCAMFVFVEALAAYGWVDRIALAFAAVCESTTLAGVVFFFIFVSTAAAGLLNNQPMAILFARALTAPSLTRRVGGVKWVAAVLSAIVGSNLGACFTLSGALAGLMCAQILHNKGIELKRTEFGMRGAPVTLATCVVMGGALVAVLAVTGVV